MSQKIESTIQFLNGLKFKKSFDEICTYSKGADLYYKALRKDNYEAQQFIVLNYFKKDNFKNGQAGFDCWIATYRNENEIGNSVPLALSCIGLSFHNWTQSWPIVKELVEMNR